MCGIVGGLGRIDERGLAAINHRGPDHQAAVELGAWWLGHTRLAILDLDARSNQPFRYGRITLAFNGEMWNYKALRAELEQTGRTFVTAGDTEVVAAALDAWGLDALQQFDGMFAIAWWDGELMRLARDRFGEVPLHYHATKRFMFASEAKALNAMGGDRRAYRWVEPGEIVEVSSRGIRRQRYHQQGCEPVDVSDAAVTVRGLIGDSTRQRAIADVPVCTLLSGGIDSSAVAFHLASVVDGLVCYTAVMDGSGPDVKQARAVAERLELELREVTIRPPTADDLAAVIRMIEMPHKAQVEIGWACVQLARRMREDGFKVTFSGEGADELMGSYGFVDHALREGKDFHATRRDLFIGQHRKNFPRCNKIFMQYGVECRLPFLHPPLVDYALSLPLAEVRHGSRRKVPITDAYSGTLPDAVVRRAKLAFQDGLGLKADIAGRLPDPQRFYRAEAHRLYGDQL